jgi:RNA polymerase sigma factor (sigma-70 family)
VADDRTSTEEEPVANVYRQLAPELVRFATTLVGPSEAADIVSAVTVRCLRSPSWPQVANQRAYLYRAVLNESRSFRRAFVRRQTKHLAAARERIVPTETEVRPEVWAAVQALSVRQRAVIVLTYWEDLSPEQIAERLQIGEGSVRRHLARGRERLRRTLADG